MANASDSKSDGCNSLTGSSPVAPTIMDTIMSTSYTVYKITNNLNGKVYIGSHQTKDPCDSYMGSGKYLKKAIAKHGVENFTKEILWICDTPELMYELESWLVNEEFLAEQNTYNLKCGGFGGWTDYNNTQSAKTSRVLGGKRSGENSKFKDTTWQENNNPRKNKLKQQLFGKLACTPEAIAKRKKTYQKNGHSKGSKNSQYGTMWITDGVTNKKINKDDSIPEGWRKGRVIAK